MVEKINLKDKVAVCSKSFSNNKVLREEILSKFHYVTFMNDKNRLSGKSLIGFLKGHNKAITALEKIDENILTNVPELKLISKFGVGLDMIDQNALKRSGVRLSWAGGVNKRAVSELVISSAINLLRRINVCNLSLKKGIWKPLVGKSLSGRKFGIIGCGAIGKDLVKLLQPFNCKIYVNDIKNYDKFYNYYNIKKLSLESLLTSCEIISLHIPLDSSTKNLLNSQKLEMIKRGSILINYARGGIVDEETLKSMLIKKHILAAAFDVFDTEPLTDVELINLENFFATPHIGGSSEEGILAMGRSAIKGLQVD